MDSMQLYQSKQSDCWIYIWILIDLRPDKCYKIQNVLLGSIILGPEPPDNLKSFLFPGLAHVAVLQCKGLPIWNAYHWKHAVTFLFLLLVLADAAVMTLLSGSVRHHGWKGCRLLYRFVGRRHRVHTITQPSYDLLDLKIISPPPTWMSMLHSSHSRSQWILTGFILCYLLSIGGWLQAALLQYRYREAKYLWWHPSYSLPPYLFHRWFNASATN